MQQFSSWEKLQPLSGAWIRTHGLLITSSSQTTRPALKKCFIALVPALVKSLQDHEKRLAYGNTSLPDWFVLANEPQSQTGINKGLEVVLDAHNDLLNEGSVDTDFQGLF